MNDENSPAIVLAGSSQHIIRILILNRSLTYVVQIRLIYIVHYNLSLAIYFPGLLLPIDSCPNILLLEIQNLTYLQSF